MVANFTLVKQIIFIKFDHCKLTSVCVFEIQTIWLYLKNKILLLNLLFILTSLILGHFLTNFHVSWHLQDTALLLLTDWITDFTIQISSLLLSCGCDADDIIEDFLKSELTAHPLVLVFVLDLVLVLNMHLLQPANLVPSCCHPWYDIVCLKKSTPSKLYQISEFWVDFYEASFSPAVSLTMCASAECDFSLMAIIRCSGVKGLADLRFQNGFFGDILWHLPPWLLFLIGGW